MKSIFILLTLLVSTSFAESVPDLNPKTGKSLVQDLLGTNDKYVSITGESAKKLYNSMSDVAGMQMDSTWIQKVGTNFTCDRVYNAKTKKSSYSCGTTVNSSGEALSGGAG